MPKNRWQLIRCVACGKPLLKYRLDDDENLQKVEMTKDEYTYDETSNIFLCNECCTPEQVVEQVS